MIPVRLVAPARGEGELRLEFSEAIEAVRSARRSGPKDERPLNVAGIVSQTERRLGGFFFFSREGDFYAFDGVAGKPHKVWQGKQLQSGFGSLLARRYGLLRTDNFTRDVIAMLEAWADARAERPETHRFSYFNHTKNTLYLSRYDGTVYKLDGQQIAIIPNGQEVLFLDDDEGEPIEADIGDHGVLRASLIDDINFVQATAGGHTPKSQSHLLYLWLHAIPFAEKFPAKPLLVMEGEKGSGKTTAIARLQTALFGAPRVDMVDESKEDFIVGLTRRRVKLLDNMDSYLEGMADILAAVATGAALVKRKRYTDSEQSRVVPYSWITITTRNPINLRRDDVADRSLVLRCERRPGFGSEGGAIEQVKADRAKLYGEWLYHLHHILAAWPSWKAPATSRYRMADFANFGLLAAQALGLDSKEVERAFASAQEERDELASEGDPLILLLEKWLENTDNHTREMPVRDLFAELVQVAEEAKMPFRWSSPLALGKHLRTNLAGIRRRIAVVEVKDRRNQAVYRFSFTSSP